MRWEKSQAQTQSKARIEPDLPHTVLADHVRSQFASAASYSLPWSRAVDYPGAVAVVAKRLKIPAPADSPIEEIERVVLSKMIEKSLSGMSEAQKLQLAEQIEAELRTRGIYRRVAFHEIVDFVKFAGMDVGGTVGGLVLAGPGLSGLV